MKDQTIATQNPDTQIPRKALALFSGGLDSILSLKWMLKHGYEVQPIFFSCPYFPTQKAIESAKANEIDLLVIDITQRHLEMIQAPSRGYGKNFNPCIDCHALMFEIAGEMMESLGAHYLISGEVVGQRPMSQTKNSMYAVSKLSKYGDLLVRPLSQKLLKDTLPIREGWINKEDMLDFSGRSRKSQMELADRLGVTEYPAPGGGCLLTNANYSLRIKDAIARNELETLDLELLRWGRHFRIADDFKLILARDEVENRELISRFPELTFIHIRDHLGPWGILRGNFENTSALQTAANIVLSYLKRAGDEDFVSYGSLPMPEHFIKAEKIPRSEINSYIITLDKD